MTADIVEDRRAIEALRSGVPGRYAVSRLGTTQIRIREHFQTQLAALEKEESCEPVVFSANFGGGKTHLLSFMQQMAQEQGFVTSCVTVSPEMPLGRANVVLKHIAECAQAPGTVGRALNTLASRLKTDSQDYADLRIWARNADINDKFRALLHLYEEFRLDDEFRKQILGDFEGKPLNKTGIRQKLREIGQLAGYELKGGPRNALLAHDRLRVYARFLKACHSKGLVILFDELERICRFTKKQRMAVYAELGWWKQVAEEAGAGILPVFATNDVVYRETVESDMGWFGSTSGDMDEEVVSEGAELLRTPLPILDISKDDRAKVKYRVRELYQHAYECEVPEVPDLREATTIRSDIRSWITHWDLFRCDPAYQPKVVQEDIEFDTATYSDELLEADEGPD